MTALIDAMKAKEQLRRRAEGHGRPIISAQIGEHRVVAVGDRLYADKRWRFFTDFLTHFMMQTLGIKWVKAFDISGRDHPARTWFRLMKEHQLRNPADASGVVTASEQPFAIATFRFAYALYLIAHHDALPKSLLRRLREPSTFRPAALETFVFAAFALAGFILKMGETRRQSAPEGEFTATSVTTGNTYHVEAKRKSGWTAPTDVENPQFQAELAQWLRQKLYAAAKKRLPNPIYWFELSIPNLDSRERAERIQQLVRNTLDTLEAELRVGGEVPASAYVVVSNLGFLAADHGTCQQVALLEGFHRLMHRKGDLVDVEDALEQHDRDRDATWVLECLTQVQEVPHSFDGTPDALVDPVTKMPVKTARVGERATFTMPDGSTVTGMVTLVTSASGTASAVILDETTGAQQIVQFALTKEEKLAAASLGDAVFGNPNSSRRLEDGDVGGLYDFFLKAYAETPRERLLSFLEKHARFEEYRLLDTDSLRRRVCREWTKVAVARSNGKKVD